MPSSAGASLWYTHTLDVRVEDELEDAIKKGDRRRVANILDWANRLGHEELCLYYYRTAESLALNAFLGEYD